METLLYFNGYSLRTFHVVRKTKSQYVVAASDGLNKTERTVRQSMLDRAGYDKSFWTFETAKMAQHLDSVLKDARERYMCVVATVNGLKTELEKKSAAG